MEVDKATAESWMKMSVAELDRELQGEDFYQSYGIDGDVPNTGWVDQVKQKLKILGTNFDEAVKKEVCEKNRYCEKIKTDWWNLVLVISSVIAVNFAEFSIPILAIVVILIKIGYFDKVCQCVF